VAWHLKGNYRHLSQQPYCCTEVLARHLRKNSVEPNTQGLDVEERLYISPETGSQEWWNVNIEMRNVYIKSLGKFN